MPGGLTTQFLKLGGLIRGHANGGSGGRPGRGAPIQDSQPDQDKYCRNETSDARHGPRVIDHGARDKIGFGCDARGKNERQRRHVRISGMKHALIFIALILVIIWVIAKVTITVTSVALHLLWVVAVILAVVWLIGRVKGP